MSLQGARSLARSQVRHEEAVLAQLREAGPRYVCHLHPGHAPGAKALFVPAVCRFPVLGDLPSLSKEEGEGEAVLRSVSQLQEEGAGPRFAPPGDRRGSLPPLRPPLLRQLRSPRGKLQLQRYEGEGRSSSVQPVFPRLGRPAGTQEGPAGPRGPRRRISLPCPSHGPAVRGGLPRGVPGVRGQDRPDLGVPRDEPLPAEGLLGVRQDESPVGALPPLVALGAGPTVGPRVPSAFLRVPRGVLLS